jgi:signal transduction histidine kinase
MDNAVKFTQKDSIAITLKKIQDDKAVVVYVKNTGAGIDAEILPRLFSKFATKSFEGTGLGLFISKKIIESHDGKIWAENDPDRKGAAFTFSLPLLINQERIIGFLFLISYQILHTSVRSVIIIARRR